MSSDEAENMVAQIESMPSRVKDKLALAVRKRNIKWSRPASKRGGKGRIPSFSQEHCKIDGFEIEFRRIIQQGLTKGREQDK